MALYMVMAAGVVQTAVDVYMAYTHLYICIHKGVHEHRNTSILLAGVVAPIGIQVAETSVHHPNCHDYIQGHTRYDHHMQFQIENST